MHNALKIMRQLYKPIDIMPLVFFRVAFGIIMLWEVWRYFHYNRIFRYYIEPTFFFKYYGFHWLHPLPGDGMFWLFYCLGLLAVLIMVGLCYRVSITLFCLGFSYVFLLDQAQYLNHFYLISLISFLLIFVPAHRALSLDVLLRPKLRTQTVPSWSLWLLRAQMTVVYTFGGLAKINPDWLRGEPMRRWLAARTDFPVIGELFTEEWMVYGFSYGGMLFDLLVVPMLLWRRTRLLALALSLVFHLTNYQLFNIGVFPWFSLAATALFLPPHWFRFNVRPAITAVPHSITARNWVLMGGFTAFFVVQIALPLRHFLYPGYVSWTEEGHNVAWRMKLRGKSSDALFFASDPSTGSTWMIQLEDYLTSRQISKMENRPAMLLRFAHYIRDELRIQGYDQIEIRAWVMASLNSRARQLLIDPTVNLAQQPYNISSSRWILPLMQAGSSTPTYPTLLISQRQDGTLMLINATEATFPLASLKLYRGEQLWFNGAELNRLHLASGECVIGLTPTVDDYTIFPICNEVARIVIDVIPELTSFSVEINGEHLTTCDDVLCMVVLPEASHIVTGSPGDETPLYTAFPDDD